MSRAAKITQAEIARAIRAAEACEKAVRMLPDGTIEFVEKPAAEVMPEPPVEARRSENTRQ